MSKLRIFRIPALVAALCALPAGARAANLVASANHDFVTAENAGASFLIANRTAASAWEEFQVLSNSDGTTSLQASINGRFVTVDAGNGGRLIASQTAIGTSEKFRMVSQSNGTVSFQAVVNNSWVSADLNIGGTLIANRAAASTWEQFTITGTGGAPNFGPNVVIFDPSMAQSTIQGQINTIFNSQQNSQFGTGRFAIVFKPGTYNVNVPVGYYTQVLGVGALPDQVNITNQVSSTPVLANNNALQNFWRGVENLSVTPPGSGMLWAVSQAVPFRRVHVRNNNLLLHLNGGFTSGGWISDSVIDFDVQSGSQQQWISRNAQWGSWTGHVWNMVFVGIPNNLPGGTWPDTAVFVPSLRTNTSGITWSGGVQTPGTSIPIDQFFIARAGVDTAATINAALAQGKHLLLTPGIYPLDDTIRVNNANTIVLGLGFATLRPNNGVVAMSVADVDGVKLAGLLFDAGTTSSPVLLQVGPSGSTAGHAANPTSLHDVFARVGGAGVGKATVSLQINSSNVIVDHTWLWRADHGSGVGWTSNTAQNGLVVNGANVTIYGLFVEHFQQFQVLWNGNGGRVFFYQSEIPYDPPDQASWRSASNVNGWASYKVADSVTSHEAWGLGIYSVFTNAGIFLTRAVEVPVTANVRFHHLTTVNLTNNGGISNVINSTGGATAPGIAVNTPRVTDFP
ncbi:MAG: coagulation factor 5/8 type domain-containing protein [Deltaproteobacteria bacterium]|nr:MAG: coagulation factor 5/8 type domain-containing protein [Deltaproteobacteria bacterium]